MMKMINIFSFFFFFDILPQIISKNDFPFVFVHGALGNSLLENDFMDETDEYWMGTASFETIESFNYYEAKVSPLGSVHDRACQLYASIIGAEKVYYGHEYLDSDTGLILEDYIKWKGFCYPKVISLLKKDSLGLIHIFLNGITINGDEKGEKYEWSSNNKIHLIGHSMGASTIRWLQYLLQIGFFPGYSFDRSNWIASITVFAGCFNGANAIYLLGADEKTGKANPKKLYTILPLIKLINKAKPIFRFLGKHFEDQRKRFYEILDKTVKITKTILNDISNTLERAYLSTINLLFNREEINENSENITKLQKIIKEGKKREKARINISEIEEKLNIGINPSSTPIYSIKSKFDYYMEHLGLKSGISDLLDFLQWLIESKLISTIHTAFYSLSVQAALNMNSVIETSPETYYFSYAVSATYESSVHRTKCHHFKSIVEHCKDCPNCDNICEEELKISSEEKECPFRYIPRCFLDVDVGDIEKLTIDLFVQLFFSKNKQCQQPTLKSEYTLFSFFSGQFDFFEKPHSNWKLTEKMLENDGILSVFSQEYPRIATNYFGKIDDRKPWGVKEPENFDWKEDNNKKFEKGKWNYANINNEEGFDHSEIIRITKKDIQFQEKRFVELRKAFKRLRNLEF